MFFDPAIAATLRFKNNKAKQDEDKSARGLAFTTHTNKKQLRRLRKQFIRQSY